MRASRRSVMPACRAIAGASLIALLISGAACRSIPFEPDRATVPYPRDQHVAATPADIQVFRRGQRIRVVNATTTDYRDVRLWLNQRYVHEVDAIAAGTIVQLPLNDFWDVWGGRPNPGGIFRRFEPTPIRIAEIQVDDSSPLIGLVTIRSERAD